MPRLRPFVLSVVVALLSSATTWFWLSSTAFPPALAAESGPGWVKGKGYGWIWGPTDERGALNTSTIQTRARARVWMVLVLRAPRSSVGPQIQP